MNRKEFVALFGRLIAQAPEGDNHRVSNMELDEDNEIVEITFCDGYKKHVNVAGDSYSSTILDIIQYGLHK